jgi:hypothetical protein
MCWCGMAAWRHWCQNLETEVRGFQHSTDEWNLGAKLSWCRRMVEDRVVLEINQNHCSVIRHWCKKEFIPKCDRARIFAKRAGSSKRRSRIYSSRPPVDGISMVHSEIIANPNLARVRKRPRSWLLFRFRWSLHLRASAQPCAIGLGSEWRDRIGIPE